MTNYQTWRKNDMPSMNIMRQCEDGPIRPIGGKFALIIQHHLPTRLVWDGFTMYVIQKGGT
jgi:hypothetical protein